MLIIDYPHDDPKLRGGFSVRTRLTATIYDQALKKSQHPRPDRSAACREEGELPPGDARLRFQEAGGESLDGRACDVEEQA